MRKPGFFVLLIILAGFHAAGQTADYPDIINNGTILLNTGIGFGNVHSSYESTCIPLIISADMAIPIASWPFTLGLAFAFSAEEESSKDDNYPNAKLEKSSDNFGIGFRTGYHIGWNVNRLDTYINLTLGAIIATETEKVEGSSIKKTIKDKDPTGIFWFQLGIGARYFFYQNIGVCAELAAGNLYFFSLSISWRL